MKVSMSSLTIQGARDSQQDNLYYKVNDEISVACVCDGMGGQQGGSLASKVAVETFVKDVADVRQECDHSEFLKKEACKLDDTVYRLTDERGDWLGAGTTFLATLIIGECLYWINVGDSKLYILRNDKMQCATRQHNYKMILDKELEQGLIDYDIYTSEQRDYEKLVSYLGMGDMSIMDITRNPFKMCLGDIFLLCTDGIYRYMSEKEIFQIINENKDDIENASNTIKNRLITLNHLRQDNATGIIIKIG